MGDLEFEMILNEIYSGEGKDIAISLRPIDGKVLLRSRLVLLNRLANLIEKIDK